MKTLGIVLVVLVAGCAAIGKDTAYRDLLTPSEMPNWKATAWRADVEPWTLADGVFGSTGRIVADPDTPECFAHWVGHADVFDDFILEFEFLFDGSGQSGVVLRGDREAAKTWEVGYELDIDRTADGKAGHLHFPVNPKPYTGKELLFTVGEWHAVRVEARGPTITVMLDDKDTLEIVDDAFQRGQICLEDGPCEKAGHTGSHVKYRNMRIKTL